MFCNKCGNQIMDGARFCSFCGTPIVEEPQQTVQPKEAEAYVVQEEVPAEIPAEPETSGSSVFEEFNWGTSDFPSIDNVAKTEDVDFNWNADPSDIKDRFTKSLTSEESARIQNKSEELIQLKQSAAQIQPEQFIAAAEPEIEEITSPTLFADRNADEMSASDKIDKFYTFSKKNEEFQKLL